MFTVALIFSNYGPYHLARLNSAYKYCQQMGWSTVGIELFRSEIEYAWQTQIQDFPIVSVVENQRYKQAGLRQLIPRLYAILAEINPDVLAIAGYANPAMLSTLGWCLLHRKPAILMTASKEDDATRNWWQEIFKGWLLKGYQSALVGGKPQKRYLNKLGMAAEAVFSGYNVVGNESFNREKIQHYTRPLEKPFFLSINRFIPKKNLFFLISAYAAYRQLAGVNAWDLVLCGDGELRPQIEQQISTLNLQNYVHLPGFLQQDQLLPYFAHASCFIHASTQEQWGLAVNEAMAASLPVLVSNRCGCYEDLVIEGENGFGFDPENSSQLISLMLKISSLAVDLQAMGKASIAHIQKFSPDRFAQGLVQAVEYALAHY